MGGEQMSFQNVLPPLGAKHGLRKPGCRPLAARLSGFFRVLGLAGGAGQEKGLSVLCH